MQAAFGDVVEWDHIDVRAHSGQLLCQQLRLLRLSLTPLIMVYSKEMRRPVFAK